MKRLSILLLAGIVAVVLQATLLAQLPGGSLKPDLLLIVVLYIGFFLAPTEGGILSFVLGYLADLLLGYLMGLFTFARVTAWLFSKLASGMLNLKSVPAQTLFVALYTVVDAFVMIGVLKLFGGAEYPAPEIGRVMLYKALLNAVAAPLVITVLFRLERRFQTIPKRGGLDLLS
jgi:rod shape-determining protein MreD